MSTVISVKDLGKKYILNHQAQQGYSTLREILVNGSKEMASKLLHPFATKQTVPTSDEFWALRDVSFDIRQGDQVGIIGRNGAGKSSLLKILSRITEPTTGKVSIKGRVASLLEVGTGFHPELTGRENIYLNGSILGMSRAEITKKFDEIVTFAEIERFLDTPVKRYSSGMYVRLAFAVAAHLEPEILIVDEVLAVGDAQFQKKCLGKMNEVGKEGRTVLFVSHNMGIISQLCPTCIWLDKGRVKQIGKTDVLANAYMMDGASSLGGSICFPDDPEKIVQLKRLSLETQYGQVSQNFDCDQPIIIKFDMEVRKQLPGLYGYIGIDKADGSRVLVSDSYDATANNPLDHLPLGTSTIEVTVPARTLGHGDYLFHISFASHSADDFQVDVPGIVCSFRLDDYTSRRGNLRAGYFSTLLPWHVKKAQN